MVRNLLQWDQGGPEDVYIDIVASNGDYTVKVCGVGVKAPLACLCWGINMEDVKAAQRNDKDLEFIFESINGSTSPTEKVFFFQVHVVKHIGLTMRVFC